MMLRLVFVVVSVAAALAAGCFNPKFKDQIACGPQGECPPGQSCGADQNCHPPGSGGNDAAVDGAQIDATPVGCTQDADCPRDITCDGFSNCVGDSICGSTGTQSRSCTRYTCQAGTCAPINYTETQSCMRSTTGMQCGEPSVKNCDACNYLDECDQAATKMCTCVAMVCMNDACTAIETSCIQNCSRSTDGQFCGTTPFNCPEGQIRDSCCRNETCELICPDRDFCYL